MAKKQTKKEPKQELVAAKEQAPVVQEGYAHTLNALALRDDVDPDRLSKFMELQKGWEADQAKKAYVAAMTAFRADCPMIKRTKKAHNSMYAGLAETIEQIKGVMKVHGLSHSWQPNQDGSAISVTCYLTHVAGHSETAVLTAQADTSGSKNSIQAIGSTVSYLERYTLFALLGLSSTEMDDDADKAEVEYITESQAVDLQSLIDETKADVPVFLKWMGVKSLEKIQVKDHKKAIRGLEKKRKEG